MTGSVKKTEMMGTLWLSNI